MKPKESPCCMGGCANANCTHCKPLMTTFKENMPTETAYEGGYNAGVKDFAVHCMTCDKHIMVAVCIPCRNRFRDAAVKAEQERVLKAFARYKIDLPEVLLLQEIKAIIEGKKT